MNNSCKMHVTPQMNKNKLPQSDEFSYQSCDNTSIDVCLVIYPRSRLAQVIVHPDQIINSRHDPGRLFENVMNGLDSWLIQ